MSVINQTNHSNLKIIEELQPNITTLADLSHVVNHIGFRGDLNRRDFQAFGNIDLKLFAVSVSSDYPEILIKSGPLYDDFEDFASKFSKVPFVPKSPFSWPTTQTDWQHSGQPETFEFSYIKPEWAWVE